MDKTKIAQFENDAILAGYYQVKYFSKK